MQIVRPAFGTLSFDPRLRTKKLDFLKSLENRPVRQNGSSLVPVQRVVSLTVVEPPNAQASLTVAFILKNIVF